MIERLVDAAARELERRARCAAAAEFHQAEGDAVHDRHRKNLRHRRFRGPHGACAAACGLGRLQEARRRFEEKRIAARHRHRDLYRSLRQHGRRHRDDKAGKGRRRHRADGLAIERAGPRHGLCADRRRSSRPAARTGSHGAGRHRPHRDRHRHRRIELDPVRRCIARQRHQDAGGKPQAACCGRARSQRRRSRDCGRRGARRRNRSLDHVCRSRQAA